MYFLNNDVLKMEYLSGHWAKLDPEVQPSNQLINVHKMHSFLNHSCSGRRHLGVISSIS
jgi:hypothetical protein